MSSQKQQFTLVVAIILLISATAILVSQHWGMMLSNSDDPWLMRATWEDVKAFANSQRRFWMLIINAITRWPYQLGGWELTNAVKIGVNSLVLFAFGLLLQRLVSLPYALLCVLSWLCLMDVSNGYYSPFHGYVLMFNLPMGLLFISLWWYTKQIDLGHTGWRLLGPYLLFGLALLGYEPMMFFAAAFPAIAFYRRQLGPSSGHANTFLNRIQAARQWVQHNWLLMAVVLIFCSVYFGYRAAHSTGTSGDLIHFGDDAPAILKTIFRFSVYGFRADLVPSIDLDRALPWIAVFMV